MMAALNDRQLALLRELVRGPLGAATPIGLRVVARTLSRRGLGSIHGYGPQWTAAITDAGRFYLAYGTYPPGWMC